MNFEENLKKLEKTVALMESGELSIDEMIKKFETGQALAAECQKELEAVRLKIEKVTANASL